ncbi:MAG: response regulator transcription factor [Treponemataceae bacterium]|nr:response regulator transcription factor [Treponemataceae bacterium]
MYRLFIVEDDPGIAGAICEQAAMWNMEFRVVKDFRQVASEVADFSPHIILLDIKLPCFNGFHWCSEIRKFSRVPIIFISSESDNMNVIMAMNMGGDDFIAKPFDQSVLMAKIQALLRRTYDFAATLPVLEHRGVILDMGDNTIVYSGKHIELTKNEYRILLTLMQNKNSVTSREKLMEALWQTDCFVDENTLSVNVGRLRKKLEAEGLADFITTKFGEGYIIK